jgi:Holliday junction resolvasome RuvABC endonuclease subunit
MKKIMGIDQSLNGTAVCIAVGTELLDFSVIRTDKTADVFSRTLFVALKLCELYAVHKPDIIHIEGLAFAMRGDATRDLAGLLFTVINVLAINHPTAKYILVPPTTLKKFATGSGKAKKEHMIASLPADIAKRFTDAKYKKTTGLADLADSYWLSQYKK